MDFVIKRIIKTFLTVLLTAAILIGLIFGFVKIWEAVKNRTETPEEPNQNEEPTEPEDNNEVPNDVVEVKAIEIQSNQENPTTQPQQPTLVQVSKTGLIIADQEVDVFPETSALLSETKVKEGDTVTAGQLIATIGNSTQTKLAEINYKRAVDSLKIAEQTLQLTQQSGQISQSTFQNQINSAQNSLKQAINQLDSSRIVRYQQDNLEYFQNQQNSNTQATTTVATNTTDTPDEEIITNQPDYQQRIENTQKQLKTTEVVNQEQQNMFAIDNAQNQLNLIYKQFESSKLQSQLQALNVLSQINQLRQQLESAQINLTTNQITSPINGVITAINNRAGDKVGPQTPLITITNFESLIVKTAITPEELFQINPDSGVNIEVLNETIPARILSTSPVADTQTKTITIKVVPTGEVNLPLIPNTFARVNFNQTPVEPEPADSSNHNNPGFKLPISLIRFQDGNASIPVIINNEISYQQVELGPIKNGHASILNGTNEGDLILVSPRLLEEGTKVNVSQIN